MPELPEIETIYRGLQHLKNRQIKNIFRSNKRLRLEPEVDLIILENAKISHLHRRGRYLIIDFDNLYSLIVHLGMSGKLTYSSVKNYVSKKHDHFICEFNELERLIFNDARRFGFIDLIPTTNLSKHKMLAKLGPEPLYDAFNAQYLAKKLKSKKINIKTAMMDNDVVTGVGNIYINESLFRAKISPLRSCVTLKIDEIKKLVKAIKEILHDAIKAGGSSISDYVDSQGNSGNFQKKFKIYGQNGKKCVICDGIVKKIVQNGRSSFYCEECQK